MNKCLCNKLMKTKYHTVSTPPKYHTVSTPPKYYTVSTPPKSNRKIVATDAKSIPLVHKYMTAHVPCLVQVN